MNFTSVDWITKFRQSSSFWSNNFTQDLLLIIGFLTVCVFLFLLCIQFILKVRQIYRTSEPNIPRKKSRYPSYQKLLDFDRNPCQCSPYSCLPQFRCIKPTCQISNPSSNYEEIHRISPTPRPHSTCVGIHNCCS